MADDIQDLPLQNLSNLVPLGAGTAPPPQLAPQEQAEQQGATVPPPRPGTGIGTPPPPQNKADFFRKMLGDFFYAAGTGLANTGHGPGSFERGLGAGLEALPQRDIAMQHLAIQRQQAQAAEEYRKAQAQALTPSIRMLDPQGNEVMVPPAHVGQALAAQYRLAGTQATATAGIVKQGMSDTSKEKIAGENIASKEKIAGENISSKEKIAGQQIALKGKQIDVQKELGFAKVQASKDIAQLKAATANDPNKLTMATKNIKQLAVSLLPEIDRVDKETDGIAKELGPGAGRWNEFWQGKVGVANPEFATYKDDVGFLSTGITLAHARGRMSNELFEHFMQMFDAGKQSPENMKAAIKVARTWMQNYASLGEPGGPLGPKAGNAPAKGGVIKYDANGNRQ